MPPKKRKGKKTMTVKLNTEEQDKLDEQKRLNDARKKMIEDQNEAIKQSAVPLGSIESTPKNYGPFDTGKYYSDTMTKKEMTVDEIESRKSKLRINMVSFHLEKLYQGQDVSAIIDDVKILDVEDQNKILYLLTYASINIVSNKGDVSTITVEKMIELHDSNNQVLSVVDETETEISRKAKITKFDTIPTNPKILWNTMGDETKSVIDFEQPKITQTVMPVMDQTPTSPSKSKSISRKFNSQPKTRSKFFTMVMTHLGDNYTSPKSSYSSDSDSEDSDYDDTTSVSSDKSDDSTVDYDSEGSSVYSMEPDSEGEDFSPGYKCQYCDKTFSSTPITSVMQYNDNYQTVHYCSFGCMSDTTDF